VGGGIYDLLLCLIIMLLSKFMAHYTIINMTLFIRHLFRLMQGDKAGKE